MMITPTLPQRDRPKPKKPRKVARHRLREKLVKLITSGAIAPGQKLVQPKLAGEFDVSISLIREALLDLQTYGLVETADNRGFFVRQFDEKTLLDLCDVREALEGMAARIACSRITDAEVESLRALIDELCKAEAAGDHDHRAEIDRQFHDSINAISSNQAILSISRQCALFGKAIYTVASVDHLRSIHTVLLNAISENRPDEAEKRAREHVQDAKRRIVESLKKGGEGIYWLASIPPASSLK